jgi:hypothetical protein
VLTGGEACLACFLLLDPAFWTPFSYWIIYGNESQAWLDLWLLLSKWGKKDDMKVVEQGKARRVFDM